MNDKIDRMYRLMILYLINNSKRALSNTEIMTFFTQNKYTDYFKVQENLYSLINTKNIIATKKENKTTYFITQVGKYALKNLEYYLPPVMIEEMKAYFYEIERKYI